MIKFFLTFLFFLFSFTIQKTLQAAIVLDDNDNYLIKSVRVEGASFEDLHTTKQAAIENAKRSAFHEVLKFLRKDDIVIDDVNINNCIENFSIVDEYYNENFYSLIMNITFDKAILQSLISKEQKNAKHKGEIGNFIVRLEEKNDILTEYVSFRNYLQKAKINFSPYSINATRIEIKLTNVVEDEIYYKLKELNLNGKIYAD